MLNSKFKSNKLSCVERRLNRFVLIYLVFLLTLTVVCLIGSIIYEQNGFYRNNWYMYGREPLYLKVSVSFFSSSFFFIPEI